MIFAQRAAFVATVPRLEPAYDDSRRGGPRQLDQELPLQLRSTPDAPLPLPVAARTPGGPAVAHRVLTAVGEVLGRRRPLHHLAAWATHDVISRIGRLAVLPTVVRSVRVSEPAQGVAEAAVVFLRGSRIVAAAARFEADDGRYRLTLFALL
jgi:hypothetical protein